MNEMFPNVIIISPKFVPDDPIDNNPALVKIMAWRRIGNNEPMLTIVNLVSTGSDNGLLPIRHQAIIWTNADPIRWPI